jgi:hypothetical protein
MAMDVPAMKRASARRLQNIIQSNLLRVIQMVIYNLTGEDKDNFTNSTVDFGHASDHCGCDDCTTELYDNVQPLINDHWDVEEEPHELMAEALDEAATEVIETLVFMGDGTNSRDVMVAILGLEAQIALLKQYLLMSE